MAFLGVNRTKNDRSPFPTFVFLLLLVTALGYAQSGYSPEEIEVRATPDMAAAVIGVLPAGQVVEIIGQQGDWVQILFSNDSGIQLVGSVPRIRIVELVADDQTQIDDTTRVTVEEGLQLSQSEGIGYRYSETRVSPNGDPILRARLTNVGFTLGVTGIGMTTSASGSLSISQTTITNRGDPLPGDGGGTGKGFSWGALITAGGFASEIVSGGTVTGAVQLGYSKYTFQPIDTETLMQSGRGYTIGALLGGGISFGNGTYGIPIIAPVLSLDRYSYNPGSASYSKRSYFGFIWPYPLSITLGYGTSLGGGSGASRSSDGSGATEPEEREPKHNIIDLSAGAYWYDMFWITPSGEVGYARYVSPITAVGVFAGWPYVGLQVILGDSRDIAFGIRGGLFIEDVTAMVGAKILIDRFRIGADYSFPDPGYDGEFGFNVGYVFRF